MTSCSHYWAMQPIENSVHSERKEFAPRGANSSLSELTPMKWEAKMKKKILLFLKVYPFILNILSPTSGKMVEAQIMINLHS